MSKYKRKYRKGDKITSFDELVKQEFIYFYDKITHCGWFKSWQIQLAQRYIERGCLYYAERIDKDTESRINIDLLLKSPVPSVEEMIVEKLIREYSNQMDMYILKCFERHGFSEKDVIRLAKSGELQKIEYPNVDYYKLNDEVIFGIKKTMEKFEQNDFEIKHNLILQEVQPNE